MRNRFESYVSARLLTVLAVLMLCVAVPARSDSLDADIEIRWEDTREATVTANVQAWQEELDGTVGYRPFREYLMNVRMLKLLLAVDERFPSPSAQRSQHYKQRAGVLVESGMYHRACEHLRDLIDTSPDDIPAVRAALSAIIDIADLMTDLEWAHYAWRRLWALDRARLLQDAELIERSFKVLNAAFLHNDMLGEVWHLLRSYTGRFGRTEWWIEANGAAIARAGHPQRAHEFMQEHAPEHLRGRYSQWSLPSTTRTVNDRDAETRWASATMPHATANDYARAMQQDSQGVALRETQPNLYHPYLMSVTSALPSANPQIVRELRRIQERDMAGEANDAARAEDWQQVMRLYRRAPWAASVHRALIMYAEAQLAQGFSGTAARTFEEVLNRSDDDSTRGKAAAGLMVSIASKNTGRSMEEALAAVVSKLPGGMTLTAGGREFTPVELARHLRSHSPDAVERVDRHASLADMPWRVLQFPALPLFNMNAWHNPMLGPNRPTLPPPHIASPMTLQPVGDKVVASSPLIVASFRLDSTRTRFQPVWVRQLPVSGDSGADWRPTHIPGEFTPSISDGRIYTRWTLNRRRLQYLSIAALDAETGDVLWTTDANTVLEHFIPINDPVAAGGNVYFAAVRRQDRAGTKLVLFCLDGDDGSIVWSRTICHTFLSVPVRGGGWWGGAQVGPSSWWEGDWWQGRFRNVSWGGGTNWGSIYTHFPWVNPVTVEDGAVYFHTDVGMVGKLDARDGAVIWLRKYPRLMISGSFGHLLRRVGTRPLLSGGKVVFAPRDYAGLFALDSETGELEWDIALVPSERVLGRYRDMLITGDATRLAAIRWETGEIEWTREVNLCTSNHPMIRLEKGNIYAELTEYRAGERGPARRFAQISAVDGKMLDERESQFDFPVQNFVVSGTEFIAVANGLDGVAQPDYDFSQLEPDMAGNYVMLWRLQRPNAQVLLPDGVPVLDRVLLYTDGVLECVPLKPDARAWNALIPPNFQGPFLGGDAIVLLYPRRLLKLNADTGVVELDAKLPFNPGTSLRWSSRTHAIGRLLADVEGRHLAFANMHWLAVFDMETDELRYTRLTKNMGLGDSWGFGAYSLRFDDGKIVMWMSDHGNRGLSARRLIINPLTLSKEVIEHERGWCGNYASGVIRRSYERRAQLFEERAKEYPICPKSGQPVFIYNVSGRKVVKTDRENGEKIEYVVPDKQAGGADTIKIIDFRHTQNLFEVMSEASDNGHRYVRIDSFNESGVHLSDYYLPEILAKADILWRRNLILARYEDSILAFARVKAERQRPAPRTILQAPAPIIVDGDLADWRDIESVDISGSSDDVELRLAHRGGRLYIAAAHRETNPRHKRKRGLYSAGNWLEIRLDGGKWVAVGYDEHGLSTAESSGRFLDNIKAEIGYDIINKVLQYEIGIPLGQLQPRCSLLIRAWRTGPDGVACTVFEWGAGGIDYKPHLFGYPHNVLLRTHADNDDGEAH